ncbi:bifunctional hemolysin/adenylate cyclase precursor [Variibacter gotjawalensis]|uniref:Bifunctional hemolysin/adenylate cyclase n=1 Tax=Variibacter gotjawalensis TaxID=1333996 RepID=A0A0S3PSG8_9BRAD|nr:hypothetical protein [Variibacter gotjawalensis]NIK49184.1 Ca2+-binding RTX toxin-like protein [Variibacter gotjawalensis]RZS51038.1 hemolysin type calcium-binding protein [Variibacter gotjawalensis]BAT58872.1 bifunctional hemolysin/adenylate cyclase precursor [Variibacter gotjawalensis]
MRALASKTTYADDTTLNTSTIDYSQAVLTNKVLLPKGPLPDLVSVPTEGNDVLRGTSSADTINALGGDDKIYGSAGADFIDGNRGFDTVDYTASSTFVMVDMHRTSGPMGFFGDADGDVLINVERVVGSKFGDFINGNDAGMTLDGGGGGDYLTGGIGNDIIIGGAGDDVLRGDFNANPLSAAPGGYDTFVVGQGADRIVDFEHGKDKIVVEGMTAAAFGTDGILATYNSSRYDEYQNLSQDKMLYDYDTDNLYKVESYQIVNGHVNYVNVSLIAHFDNGAVPTASDFLFV